MHAHDPDTFDHQDIRYYIFKDDSVIGGDSVFEVDAKTGLIKTKGSVKKGEYHLEIAAEYENKPGQQPGQFYNTTKVFVFVRMGDISMPHFLKEFREISLPENSKINTKVGTVSVLCDPVAQSNVEEGRRDSGVARGGRPPPPLRNLPV